MRELLPGDVSERELAAVQRPENVAASHVDLLDGRVRFRTLADVDA